MIIGQINQSHLKVQTVRIRGRNEPCLYSYISNRFWLNESYWRLALRY